MKIKAQQEEAIKLLYQCGIYKPKTITRRLEIGGMPVSLRTVQRKVAVFKTEGTTGAKRLKKLRRKPVLTQAKKRKILELNDAQPFLSAQDIKIKLKLSCSLPTIRTCLKDFGKEYLSTILKPQLKPDHITDRLNFALAHVNKPQKFWKTCFFLDEASFWCNTARKKCYQYRDQRVSAATVKYPGKVHVIGMISAEGRTRLLLFSDDMNAKMFVGFFKKLITDAKELYPRRHFRILMDLDPKHTSTLAKNYIREKELDVPKWPASSPDLNPIENVWGFMKKEIPKLGCRNTKELEKAIRSLWARKVTEDYCYKLALSMPRRLQSVIDNKGLSIDY